jgi:hypothetical protein
MVNLTSEQKDLLKKLQKTVESKNMPDAANLKSKAESFYAEKIS